MGGKNKAPEAPKAPPQTIATYNNGFGDMATQNSFTPSQFNKDQMAWSQEAQKQLQSKLFDTNAADQQAKAYADNLKSQGLKSFTKNANDLYSDYLADSAKRFGSIDNSSFNSNMKRFGEATQEGLQNLSHQYDANYQQGLNDYTNYYGGLLGTAQNVSNNLYNLASGQSGLALNSSNATNAFNNQQFNTRANIYNTQSQLYAQQQALKLKQQQELMNSALKLGAGFATGGSSLAVTGI